MGTLARMARLSPSDWTREVSSVVRLQAHPQNPTYYTLVDEDDAKREFEMTLSQLDRGDACALMACLWLWRLNHLGWDILDRQNWQLRRPRALDTTVLSNRKAITQLLNEYKNEVGIFSGYNDRTIER
jgi:hypothetical protein